MHMKHHDNLQHNIQNILWQIYSPYYQTCIMCTIYSKVMKRLQQTTKVRQTNVLLTSSWIFALIVAWALTTLLKKKLRHQQLQTPTPEEEPRSRNCTTITNSAVEEEHPIVDVNVIKVIEPLQMNCNLNQKINRKRLKKLVQMWLNKVNNRWDLPGLERFLDWNILLTQNTYTTYWQHLSHN